MSFSSCCNTRRLPRQVYERPLLIFPPWINKFYILDLRPENSFIKWLIGQGYTVFVASWINPDKKMAQKSFEDYMHEGIFAALDAVEKATGVRDPNVVGYCIGGTLLGGHPRLHGEEEATTRIHSATFWAAQVDFSEAGDLKIFIDDAQLDALKQQMDAAGGVLEGRKMATTFNMLRANDLIWSFVMNNYLLGKTPAPFDLLFWNSDTTRMPEKMHLFYLRECYRDNALALGKMKFGDVALDLTNVKVPVYLQSAKDDHVAPFRSVYKATKLFKGPVRFMMAGSGHIAGVDQSSGRRKIPVLDQRQIARHRRRVAGRCQRTSRFLVAGLGQMAFQTFRQESPGAQTGQRKTESAVRRAGNICND